MPELPEVETVCRGLNRLARDRVITGGEVLLTRTLAAPDSAAVFLAGVTGKAIAQWRRRGKYLLGELQPEGGTLGIHLRMTGQLLWTQQAAPLQKHCRLRLFFPEGQELRFVDTRTFGKVWWVPPATPVEEVITGLQKLGAEPFSTDFSSEYLAVKLSKTQRTIKTALLDQSVLAGLGNIYADEALFVSGIRPTAIASRLAPAQLQRLHEAILEVLQTSIDKGGTTFSDFLNPSGVNGNYGGVAWVYGRAQQPCRRCQTPIARLRLGGRSAHYCPNCQKSAAKTAFS